MSNKISNQRHLLIVVLCTCILGLYSMVSYAATKKVAADQATTDNSSQLKEQKLQEIYDSIDIKFSNLRTDLKLSYLDNGRNYDTLSIDYNLVNRHGCNIEINDNVNATHTEEYTATESTKSHVCDLYCNTININMCKIQSISIARPKNNPSFPKIFNYNPDILNNCIYINFKAVSEMNAFRLKQNKHIRQYSNSEHHEKNKYEMEDTPKEISDSFSTYSICISDEELAERLVRAFNDYRNICGAKDELY